MIPEIMMDYYGDIDLVSLTVRVRIRVDRYPAGICRIYINNKEADTVVSQCSYIINSFEVRGQGEIA